MPGRVTSSAASWVCAWRPAPMKPATRASSRDRYFAATPPAAPVRTAVRYVASMIASGKPVSGSNTVRVAMTEGRWMLSGWTLTFLTAAVPRSGR